MVTVILIIFAIVIIGLIVWFFISNKKPTPPQPTPDTGTTPDSGDTIDSGDTPDSGGTEPECICDSKCYSVIGCVPFLASDERITVGRYDTDKMCDCTWTITSIEKGDNFLKDFEFEDGFITAVVSETNYGEQRTTRYVTTLKGDNVTKANFFDVTQCSGIDTEFEYLVNAFSSEVTVERFSKTYNYLKELYYESKVQYYGKSSKNGLPSLYREENFPNIYNFYGENGNVDSAYKSFVGWLFALQLSELKPYNRVRILKIGYELGGYNKYSNIYGYKFEFDPNVARMVASSLYVTMRATLKPDVDAMRQEVGGKKYEESFTVLYEADSDYVGDDDFFTDFRKFMPTAPGPYAPGYKTRPDETYPNEEKDEYKNLAIDRAIYELAVSKYNIGDDVYNQDAIQAIADKEACPNHLYGKDVKGEGYEFYPVFGETTIGRELNPGSFMAEMARMSMYASSYSRSILQSSSVNPKQYGRLRPGCSWEKEAKKHSDSDDRYNILCDFVIEDNDGCPTGYYNKSGNFVYPKLKDDTDYCEYYKKQLWANSYPSGHSAGIWGAAMVLMELMPDIADRIMRSANRFAVNRTVARYHWNSDTINGRIIGGATNAISHAVSDYDELLNKARKGV